MQRNLAIYVNAVECNISSISFLCYLTGSEFMLLERSIFETSKYLVVIFSYIWNLCTYLQVHSLLWSVSNEIFSIIESHKQISLIEICLRLSKKGCKSKAPLKLKISCICKIPYPFRIRSSCPFGWKIHWLPF